MIGWFQYPEKLSQPNIYNSLIPPAQAPLLFSVQWQGQDASSGIARSNLQACSAPDCTESSPAWSDYLQNTTQQAVEYIGSQGQAVHFRVKAWDRAGNPSPWQPAGPVTVQTETKELLQRTAGSREAREQGLFPARSLPPVAPSPQTQPATPQPWSY
jgi:hypothetical protein